MIRVLVAVALVAVVGVFAVGCGQVGPGERAVFVRWGVIDQKCYEPGLYFYNPVSTSMDRVDVKTRKYEVEKLAAASQDLQEIHADVVVNYVLDSASCHLLLSNVGHEYEARVIAPAVSEVLKAATAHFPIDKIIRERVRLREEIFKGLQARLGVYHLKVESVSLTDFGFSQAFAQAVERKQIEEQRVQEAEYRRQQAVKNAEASVALADGQAKANKLLAESLRSSPETIEFRRLEVREKEIARWNGVLPQTIFGGNSAIPLVSVGK